MKDEFNEAKRISEIANNFTVLGFNRILSSTLACLFCKGEISSYEIERFSGLRQPEVSYAMKDLRKLGWVATKRVVSDRTRGRPAEIHSLSTDVENILNNIEKQLNEKHETDIKNLRNIKASLE